MAALRNLNERLPNGRRIFGIPYIGYTGAEIVARTTAGTGDSGPGLFVNDSLEPTSRYRLIVVSTTIPPLDLLIREDGSGSVRSYGTITYDVYEDNLRLTA